MSEYDFKFGKDREEKIDKFLDNLAWHFSTKSIFDKTATAVKSLTETIWGLNQALTKKAEELNTTIKEASEASGRLTKALNRLTFWGIIIAGTGVFVALGALIFEIFKYFYANN